MFNPTRHVSRRVTAVILPVYGVARNPTPNMKPTITSKFGHVSEIAALAFAALSLWPAASPAADIFWSDGTASYTNAAAWGGTVPGGGDHAINNNGSNNIAQINAADPAWTVVDLIAGNADNT